MSDLLCPVCATPIAVHLAKGIDAYHQARLFYYFQCVECGFGPTQAYESPTQAQHRWDAQKKLARMY